ncbi:MAG: ATP-binding protein [Candidatus Micrarchaeota archaeon]
MKLKESESVGLKKSTGEMKDAVISIVSILNKHKAGKLYFGVSNRGQVLGQEISEKTLRDISQAVAESIEPKIYPSIRRIEILGKTCVEVDFSGENQPYFAYGRAYVRVGDEDRQLSARELESFFLNNLTSPD